MKRAAAEPATTVHPLAVVEPGASLGAGVEVGAFAYIGGRVVIGDGCRIHHHATVEGRTILGRDNEVFPYALVGGKTHDLKYRGGEPGLRIGDRNVFREYATAHVATAEGDWTEMGDDNHILAYSHIAHDCRVGNHLVMSSHAALAGHVEVGDHANIGWGAGVHQFCRIGRFAMVSATSKVVQDVPPFFIADGNPADSRTVNRIALERAGFAEEAIVAISQAFKTLFREGLNRSQGITRLEERGLADDPHVREIIAFIRESDRGVC